jgi:DNA-binding HxlR family transcriptional regulator
VHGYGQYCPVAVGTELVADRWTVLVVRELMVGAHRFNDIERGLPRISRSLLVDRLRRLERAGIVERRPLPGGRASEYHLTPAGRDLERVVWSLGEWAVRWSFADPREDQIDGGLLLWRFRQGVRLDRVPAGRTVVRFRLTGERPLSAWLVIRPDEASVCLRHPGFGEDLVVTADNRELHRVWLGRTSIGKAMAAGLVRLEGPPPLVRGFPRWFAWSPFSPTVRRASAQGGSGAGEAIR